MKNISIFLILSSLVLLVPGCMKTDSSEPEVKDPYGMFTYTRKANGIVSFTNTSTDATSYLWDFGDGQTSTTAVVTFDHQYLQNGSYHAILTAYGNGKSDGAYADLNITTAAGGSLPTVDTDPVTNITRTTATSGGNVTSEGSFSITARGVCWSTAQNPTVNDNKTSDGTGTGSFTSDITGLTANTPYYVRAYATNSSGTGYGNQKSFTTQQGTSGTVTDIDGNVYITLTIGTQTWMAEDLKTTKYNDGTAIPLVTDGDVWANLTTPAYCWYNNDAATYKTTYGALYNWYTVNTGKLAPTGWHIPTDAEWTILTTYLGGESVAGGKIKSTGTIQAGTGLWYSPNAGATNESGFTAVPAGYRDFAHGAFIGIGYYCNWWSSSEAGTYNVWTRGVAYQIISVSRVDNIFKETGISVRCLKD